MVTWWIISWVYVFVSSPLKWKTCSQWKKTFCMGKTKRRRRSREVTWWAQEKIDTGNQTEQVKTAGLCFLSRRRFTDLMCNIKSGLKTRHGNIWRRIRTRTKRGRVRQSVWDKESKAVWPDPLQILSGLKSIHCEITGRDVQTQPTGGDCGSFRFVDGERNWSTYIVSAQLLKHDWAPFTASRMGTEFKLISQGLKLTCCLTCQRLWRWIYSPK